MFPASTSGVVSSGLYGSGRTHASPSEATLPVLMRSRGLKRLPSTLPEYVGQSPALGCVIAAIAAALIRSGSAACARPASAGASRAAASAASAQRWHLEVLNDWNMG